MKKHPFFLVATTLLLSVGSLCNAAVLISADFTDGTGSSSVDQYTGKVGDGWATAWEAFAQGGRGDAELGVTAGARTVGPLDANDPNHMRVDYAYTKARTDGKAPITTAGVRRQYDLEVIDPSKDHSISFLFRLDEVSVPEGGTFTISLRGSDIVTGSSSSRGWHLNWSSETGWFAYNGNGKGSYSITMVTGISQEIGTVYKITIDVSPENHHWALTISDGTNPPVSLTDLGFRWSETTAGYENYYLDNTIGFIATSTMVGTELTYSIDQLHITQIPEPRTELALFFGAGCLFLYRSLRHPLRSDMKNGSSPAKRS